MTYFLHHFPSILGFLITYLISLLIIFLSVRWGHLNRNFDQIQNSHQHVANRYGGAAIAVAMLLVVCYQNIAIEKINIEIQVLFFFSWAALFIGFLDDILGHVSPIFRSLAMIGVAVIAGFNLGWLDKVHIDLIDNLVNDNLILGASLTVVGVVGLTNSFNLIDGLNGLCSGTAILILAALCYVSSVLGFKEFTSFYLLLIFCIFGFFILNFPRGRIFLGDGGAYFLGFLIAQGCILLNSRSTEISSWVFVLMCIYNIWETIFSMLRRAISRQSWSVADRGHLHQLVFDNLCQGKSVFQKTTANALASILCLLFPAASSVLAMMFFDSSSALQLACICLVIVYLAIYFSLRARLTKANTPARF